MDNLSMPLDTGQTAVTLKAANSLAEECRQLVSQAKAVTESDEITLGQKVELVSLIGRSLKISTEFGWLLAAGLEDELLPSEVMELGEVAQLSAMLAGIIN